jgi:5-methylcytosine-specific restriction endonuclease McrA
MRGDNLKGDYEDFKDRQRRDMWKAFPEERLRKLQTQIIRMKPSRDKAVLELAFIHGLTTTEIAEVAKTRLDMLSRNGRPISLKTIQNTIAKYVPDRSAYQDHSQKDKPHHDHGYYATHHKKERCANCGGTESLEWHHMIPAILGGTAEPENMICLCHNCHLSVSAYHRKLFPDKFGRPRKQKGKNSKTE